MDVFGEQLGMLAETSHLAPCPITLFEALAGGAATALLAELVQVLEWMPAEGSFVLRSGRGFPEEPYDGPRVPGGLLSQADRVVLDPQGREHQLMVPSRVKGDGEERGTTFPEAIHLLRQISKIGR